MQATLPFFIADGAQSQGQQFLRLQYGINIAGITLRIIKGSIQQQYCGMDPFYSPSGSLQTSTQPSAPAAASSSCKVSLTAVWPLPAALLFLQQPFIAQIHGKGTKGSRQHDSQHRHGKHGIATGKAQRQRNAANGSLHF